MTAESREACAPGDQPRRSVLIVSPHFPPVDAADMHRVRLCLPYLRDFGWEPIVLTVAPEWVERPRDDALLDTVPDDVVIERVRAAPAWATRWLGISSLGLRALPFLYRAGNRIIAEHRCTLVFFSTTEFFCLPLARLWTRRHPIRAVVDLQDPWVGDYYARNPSVRPPRKYWLSRPIHRVLERWSTPSVSGWVTVSAPYVDRLRARYAGLEAAPGRTIPFSASRRDFEIAQQRHGAVANARRTADRIELVYAGVVPGAMHQAIRVLFKAFAEGLARNPALFKRLGIALIGTHYSAGSIDTAISRLAREFQVQEHVQVETRRRPYLETLQILRSAAALLLLGTDNPEYTASKLFPYILSGRPIVAVFMPQSSTAAILKATRAGTLVELQTSAAEEAPAAERVRAAIESLAASGFRAPDTDWRAFAPYEASEMTRQLCALFNDVADATTAD